MDQYHKIKGYELHIVDNHIESIHDSNGMPVHLYIRMTCNWLKVNHKNYSFTQVRSGIYKNRMRFA